MSTPAPEHAADPAAGDLRDDWVLTVRLADGRIEGVPFRRRESFDLFFAGYLVHPCGVDTRGGPSAGARRADADLVLDALVRDGVAVVDALRGSFVLAVVDRRAGRTLVARDPIGVHPLYVAEVPGEVRFAASALALTASPGVPTDVNVAVLADHLCHRWAMAAPEETYLKAVRRLTPGTRAVVANGRLGSERAWDPMPEGEPIRWLSEEETAAFPGLFDQSVDRCVSLGHPGVFLSGGLDSISIAAVTADRCVRLGRQAPHALSLAFPTPETDETREQTAVARALAMPQRLLTFGDAVGSRGLLGQAIELNRQLSSPLLNRWEPAYGELARQGRALGVDVVLSGTGGDEWLSVTPLLSADLVRRGDVRGFVRFVRAWQRSYHYPTLHLYRNAFWRFGARPLASQQMRAVMPETWKRRRMRKYQAAAPPWVSPDPAIRRMQRERLEAEITAPPPADGFYVRELRESLRHPLVSIEREERFEFARRNGVRYAQPFWDPDLVDLLMRTRPEHLNREGRSKGLVRQTVAARLPGLDLDRQVKRTGTSFSRELIATEGRALMAQIGKLRALADLGIVDGPRAWEFVRRAVDTRDEQIYRVWDLLNVEYWVRTRIH